MTEARFIGDQNRRSRRTLGLAWVSAPYTMADANPLQSTPSQVPSWLTRLVARQFPPRPFEARFALDPVAFTERFLRSVQQPGAPWTGAWTGNRFVLERRGYVFFRVLGRLSPAGSGSRVDADVEFSPKAWVWWLLVVHAVFVAFILLWTMGTEHYYEAAGVVGFVLIYGWMIRVLLMDDLEQTRKAAERELRFLGEH